jgi:hypothetical protein
MECLRFGSSIPGSYWGCCAVDIYQNFKVDPDDKASIQLANGDAGVPIQNSAGQTLFSGPTWRDIFWQRLRIGTFSDRDMPNHAFLAILTEWQINSGVGKKWLSILREAGFEFIRTQNNSVYSGQSLGEPVAESNNNDNHIFGLFRNIGANALRDPFTPPKEWTDLEKVKTEQWDFPGGEEEHFDFEWLAKLQHKEDTVIWNKIGPAKFLTEAEVVAAGAPVILAGLRSANPQEAKATRDARKAAEKPVQGLSAFPVKKPASVAIEVVDDVYEDFDEDF